MCYSVMIKKDLNALSRSFGVINAHTMEPSKDGLCQIDNILGLKTSDERDRIFPDYQACVFATGYRNPQLKAMRYRAFAPSYLTPDAKKQLAAFNARRDSLQKRFWSESFGKRHGILAIQAFYEWVQVKDVLQAGRVSRNTLDEYFAFQVHLRRQKWIEDGKDPQKYKPTKSEVTPLFDRKVVIKFESDPNQPLLIPLVCSKDSSSDQWGFALITHEPTEDISRAGHDRMPVCLTLDAAKSWVSSETVMPTLSHEQWQTILDATICVKFEHSLAKIG